MEFYTSLTINRCHLLRLIQIWADHYPVHGFPFRRAIVSPLFARNGILAKLYEQRKHCKVIFDSGGFHIQQGRMRLSLASRQLRKLYRENDWADRFVVPDSPVISLDSEQDIAQKLRSTLRQYRTFPTAFPELVRKKLLPVVHGTTPGEICRSLESAKLVGSDGLGFGGFATSGPNAGVNSFTPHTLKLLTLFTSFCQRNKLRRHIFGIGGPAAITVLNYAAVDTFDSAGWIRTAAYGNAYLPYLGAVNVTGAANSRRYMSKREFTRLRKRTGHRCSFCQDHDVLVQSWRHRALHNFCTVSQVVQDLKRLNATVALAHLRAFNPRYAGCLELVLEERAHSAPVPNQPRNCGRALNA
jgi:hypothetical protein